MREEESVAVSSAPHTSVVNGLTMQVASAGVGGEIGIGGFCAASGEQSGPPVPGGQLPPMMNGMSCGLSVSQLATHTKPATGEGGKPPPANCENFVSPVTKLTE